MSCDFIFCLHNHQPVGNFDYIFKWAFTDCYNKIIGIFKEYPEFRFAIHHSGPVLEWIKDNSPEYLQTLSEMNKKGQLEIIGGGFYEPIFSIIGERDIKSQIGLMQNFCFKEFGVRPKGFWTAERVWDPEIPNLVSGYDLLYTILDDIHFRYAGIPEEELYGYFITERLNNKLIVFPIDKFLRYSIPFRLPEDTINYFKEKSDRRGHAAFIYGDDGEKFGLWPETYKWVFEEKWLRNFIEAILKEGWIRLTHPSEYIATHKPRGKVYLTQGSYFELSEWALPPAAALKLTKINNEIKSWNRENDFYPFLKGGVWNNFLIKYPESNTINKRTLLLSKEISEYESRSGTECKDAKTELYKGECNCAYWHGLFGGIYLNHLRHALYEHILLSESSLLQNQEQNGVRVIEDDIWNEGHKQILIRTKNQSAIIVPFNGGTVSELGIYSKAFNIFNTLPRRYEAYHEILKNMNDDTEDTHNQEETVASIHDRIAVKEKNLKKYLIFDKSRRYSFKDLFFDELPSPGDLMFGTVAMYDCGLLEYKYNINNNSRETSVSLNRSINLHNEDLIINKDITISDNMTGIKVQYSLIGITRTFFGVEININLLSSHDENKQYEIPGTSETDSYLDTPGLSDRVRSFALVDKYNEIKIKISTSIEATLLRYPVYTVSQSDSGFEKNYQGSSLILVYKFTEQVNNFYIELLIE